VDDQLTEIEEETYEEILERRLKKVKLTRGRGPVKVMDPDDDFVEERYLF